DGRGQAPGEVAEIVVERRAGERGVTLGLLKSGVVEADDRKRWVGHGRSPVSAVLRTPDIRSGQVLDLAVLRAAGRRLVAVARRSALLRGRRRRPRHLPRHGAAGLRERRGGLGRRAEIAGVVGRLCHHGAPLDGGAGRRRMSTASAERPPSFCRLSARKSPGSGSRSAAGAKSSTCVSACAGADEDRTGAGVGWTVDVGEEATPAASTAPSLAFSSHHWTRSGG